MASFIPVDGPIKSKINTPLSLSALQNYVGGFIRFVELNSGDYMVVNEASTEFSPKNESATSLAGRAGPIYGPAVLCEPSEIE